MYTNVCDVSEAEAETTTYPTTTKRGFVPLPKTGPTATGRVTYSTPTKHALYTTPTGPQTFRPPIPYATTTPPLHTTPSTCYLGHRSLV